MNEDEIRNAISRVKLEYEAEHEHNINCLAQDNDKICKAISDVKLEDEAYHERNIEYLDQEDDNYKSPWKEDVAGLNAVTNSSDSGEIAFKNTSARKEPIKDTQNLKEAIRVSHLGKRVRQSESGSTDMDPVVT